MVSAKRIFGQVNCMYPRVFDLKSPSLESDFAFVSRMFFLTGNDIKAGIDVAKKSDDKKRTGIGY